MTEDEKRQQKAMLLLEHQEAEEHLAHLEAKAATMSERIKGVAEWLERAAKRRASLDDTFYSSRAAHRLSILDDPQVKIAMDFDAAKKLIADIQEARNMVERLSERKQSLGLK